MSSLAAASAPPAALSSTAHVAAAGVPSPAMRPSSSLHRATPSSTGAAAAFAAAAAAAVPSSPSAAAGRDRSRPRMAFGSVVSPTQPRTPSVTRGPTATASRSRSNSHARTVSASAGSSGSGRRRHHPQPSGDFDDDGAAGGDFTPTLAEDLMHEISSPSAARSAAASSATAAAAPSTPASAALARVLAFLPARPAVPAADPGSLTPSRSRYSAAPSAAAAAAAAPSPSRHATRSPSVTRIPAAASASSTRSVSPAPSAGVPSRAAASSSVRAVAAPPSAVGAPSPHSLALQLRSLQQALASMTAERDALRMERDELQLALQDRDTAEHAQLTEHLAALEAAQAETLAAEAERQAAATAAQSAQADAEHWHAEAEAWQVRCEELEVELQQLHQQQQQQQKAATPRLRSKSPASPATSHSAELARLRSQLAAVAPLETELQSHRAQVKTLQRQLDHLQRDHAAAEETHRSREEALRRAHARAIASLQAEHASTLSGIGVDSTSSLASLKTQHAQTLMALKTDHAQAMAMLPSTAAFQALQKQLRELQTQVQAQEQATTQQGTLVQRSQVVPNSPPSSPPPTSSSVHNTLRSFETALSQSQSTVSSLRQSLSDSQASNVQLLERAAKQEMHIEILSAHMKDMELAAQQQQQQQQQQHPSSAFTFGSPAKQAKSADVSAGLTSPSVMRAATLRVSALEDQLRDSQASLAGAEDRLRAEQATVVSLRSLLKAADGSKLASDTAKTELDRLTLAHQKLQAQSDSESAACDQLAAQLRKQTQTFDEELARLKAQLESKTTLEEELRTKLAAADAVAEALLSAAAPPAPAPAAAAPQPTDSAALEVRSLTLELASTKQLLSSAQADASRSANAVAATNAASVAAAASFALESTALRAQIVDGEARVKELQQQLDEATTTKLQRDAPVADSQPQSAGASSSDSTPPAAASAVAAAVAPEPAVVPPSILQSEHDSLVASLRDSHATALDQLTKENAALESSLAPLRLCAVQLAMMQEEKVNWDRTTAEQRGQLDSLRSQVDDLRAEKQQQASISHDRLSAANAEKLWLHQQLEQVQQSVLLRARAPTQKRILQQSLHALADLRSYATRTRSEVLALQGAAATDLAQLQSTVVQLADQHRSALAAQQGANQIESSKLILALNAASLRLQELESAASPYALHPSALSHSSPPGPVRPAQVAWEAETRKAVSEVAALREQLRDMAEHHAQQLAAARADRAHSHQQDEDETASFQLRLRQMQREKEELVAAHDVAIRHLTAAGSSNAALAAAMAAPGSLAQKLAEAQQALGAAQADHQSALQAAAHRLAQTQADHQEQWRGLHQQLSDTEHRLREQHASQQLAQGEVAALHDQLSTLAALGNSQANQISHLRRSLTLATEGEDARVSEALAEGRRELRESQESVRALQAQVDRFSLAFNELRASSDAMANEKARMDSAEQSWVVQRDSMLQAHAHELDQSRCESHDLRLRHEDLLRELRALRQEFASTSEDRDSASNSLELLRDELACARRDREHFAEQSLEHAARVLHLQSALDALRMQTANTDHLRTEYDALRRAAEAAEQDRRRLQTQLNEAHLLRADLHGTITATQEKLSAAESELHQKHETIASLRRELDMLRLQLQQGAQSTAASNVALKATLAAAEKQIEGQHKLIQSLRVELDTLARNSEVESRLRSEAQRALADRDLTARPTVHRSHDAERADTLPAASSPGASRRPGGSAPAPVSPTFEAFFQPDASAGRNVPVYTLASGTAPIPFAPSSSSLSPPHKLVSDYYPIHSAAIASANRSSNAAVPMNGSHHTPQQQQRPMQPHLVSSMGSPSKLAMPPLPAVPEYAPSTASAGRSSAAFTSPPSSSLKPSGASSYASPSFASPVPTFAPSSSSAAVASSSFASAFASANAAFIASRSGASAGGSVQPTSSRTSLSPEAKHEQAVLDAMGRGGY